MSKQLPVSVVTTIQPPTESIRQLSRVLQNNGCPLIVIGDAKGPFEYNVASAELVTFNQQLALPFSLATLLPEAITREKILDSCWLSNEVPPAYTRRTTTTCRCRHGAGVNMKTDARPMAGSGWVNVYRAFTDLFVWPRGFPLEYCRQSFSNDILTQKVIQVESPIQQGLSNGSPDVDAVWRLVMDKTITFRDEMSVILPRNAWCPFNSQHVVVAGSVSLDVFAQSLFVSHDGHLAQSRGATVSCGNGTPASCFTLLKSCRCATNTIS